MTPEGQVHGSSPAYSEEFVRDQVRHIEECLARALAGDFEAVRLPEGDTMWGNLAMHVNVVIHATRAALTRAERFEKEAAALRAVSQPDEAAMAVRSIRRPARAARPQGLVVDDERTTR